MRIHYKYIETLARKYTFDLTFLDPPFNQNKEYTLHDDNLPDQEYWHLMKSVCLHTRRLTSEGDEIYFMQREKNAEKVL